MAWPPDMYSRSFAPLRKVPFGAGPTAWKSPSGRHAERRLSGAGTKGARRPNHRASTAGPSLRSGRFRLLRCRLVGQALQGAMPRGASQAPGPRAPDGPTTGRVQQVLRSAQEGSVCCGADWLDKPFRAPCREAPLRRRDQRRQMARPPDKYNRSFAPLRKAPFGAGPTAWKSPSGRHAERRLSGAGTKSARWRGHRASTTGPSLRSGRFHLTRSGRAGQALQGASPRGGFSRRQHESIGSRRKPSRSEGVSKGG
jgi:hypothetical protein